MVTTWVQIPASALLSKTTASNSCFDRFNRCHVLGPPMSLPFAFGGLCLVSVGAYPLLFPHETRNWVRSSEWQANPREARRKQERYARIVGAAISLGLGVPLFVAGVVT